MDCLNRLDDGSLFDGLKPHHFTKYAPSSRLISGFVLATPCVLAAMLAITRRNQALDFKATQPLCLTILSQVETVLSQTEIPKTYELSAVIPAGVMITCLFDVSQSVRMR